MLLYLEENLGATGNFCSSRSIHSFETPIYCYLVFIQIERKLNATSQIFHFASKRLRLSLVSSLMLICFNEIEKAKLDTLPRDMFSSQDLLQCLKDVIL